MPVEDELIYVDCTLLGFNARSENSKSYMVDGFRNSCGWQSVMMGNGGGANSGLAKVYF